MFDSSGHDFDLGTVTADEYISDEEDSLDVDVARPVWVQATAIVTAASIITGGGLVFTQNGSPTTILGAYALQVQTQVQMNPAAAGQAYNQAVQTAVMQGKYTRRQILGFPKFWVFKNVTPDIYQNDADAMAGRQTRGGASSPVVPQLCTWDEWTERDRCSRMGITGVSG